MKYAVAIDVGGTNTRVALVNERLEITDRFIRGLMDGRMR